MSQNPVESYDMDLEERPRNPVGIVGFILAFCLPPIGLLLSLIALAFRPRGFAIAGVLVGIITTSVVAIVAVFSVQAVQTAARFAQVADNAVQVQAALEAAKSPEGLYPADLASANPPASALNDPWGTPFRYEPTGGGVSYLLISAGPDKAFDTTDDLLMDRYADRELITVTGAGSGVGSMFGAQGASYVRVMFDMARLGNTLYRVKIETGAYPATLADVPGMTPKAMTDPWGSPYEYAATTDGRTFHLRSLGPDRQPDTGDDIDSGDVKIRTPRQQKLEREAGASGGSGAGEKPDEHPGEKPGDGG